MSSTLAPRPSGTRDERLLRAEASATREGAERRLTSAIIISSCLAVIAAVSAAIVVFHPEILREVAWTTGNAQGTALVIMTIAVPTVVISMAFASRGSRRALITWLGALAYILYNAVFFAYGIHFNALFLLNAATLGLAFWSVVTLVQAVDLEDLRLRFRTGRSARIFAGYVAIANLPFVLLWLKDIIPAMIENRAPDGLSGTGMINNPVEMTDFAFSFPLIAMAVFWLWQRRNWGYLMIGALLVYGVIEAISVGSDQMFGHLRDGSQSAAAVPMFVALALISLVPAIAFLRSIHDAGVSPERRPSPRVHTERRGTS